MVKPGNQSHEPDVCLRIRLRCVHPCADLMGSWDTSRRRESRPQVHAVRSAPHPSGKPKKLL